jgi:nicotinamidase-related amidase
MKKCLIVVDYQNDFVSGSLGFPGAAELERYIVQKIKQYRDNGGEVVFTFDTHGEDYMNTKEGRNLPVAHCLKDTDGHKLYGQVSDLIQESDKQLCKNTFGSDALYMYLRMEAFESIELVGLVSNICVISNAILAKTAQPETPVIVDAKCTASHDSKLNQAALDVMESLQIQIINRQERK